MPAWPPQRARAGFLRLHRLSETIAGRHSRRQIGHCPPAAGKRHPECFPELTGQRQQVGRLAARAMQKNKKLLRRSVIGQQLYAIGYSCSHHLLFTGRDSSHHSQILNPSELRSRGRPEIRVHREAAIGEVWLMAHGGIIRGCTKGNEQRQEVIL